MPRTWSILQHVAWEGPGLIAAEARARGLPIEVCRIDAGDIVPPIEDVAGLIVMGGPMSVHDASSYPYLVLEQQLIGAAVERQLPVLGVCLGAQLLAAALGARVCKGPKPEIGLGEVNLTAQGLSDAVLGPAGNVDPGFEYYLSNLRVAAGTPDTGNKLLTEGRWTTRGILFDVNSDRIKGESYGILKQIAGVLTESPGLKVQIVGHTDADGDESANMDLSKRRAESVRTALAQEFGIDAGRLETDGKGESEPVDKNDNPAGKANNRRVEFVRK